MFKLAESVVAASGVIDMDLFAVDIYPVQPLADIILWLAARLYSKLPRMELYRFSKYPN